MIAAALFSAPLTACGKAEPPPPVDDTAQGASPEPHKAGLSTGNTVVLLAGAAVFGIGCAAAAMAPSYALFGVMLFVIGIAAQTLTTSTNSLVQTSTELAMRGRAVDCRVASA